MKRPWNIVDVPVYSLATYTDTSVNMNICTYVSAVSMSPKLYMIAIDYHTKSFENLRQKDRAILQLLHSTHAPLVKLLGKKSGQRIDKEKQLDRKDMLTTWDERKVLRNASAYLSLVIKDSTNIGGDHELFYFEVEKSVSKSSENILMFQELIKQGIIL